MVINQLTSEAFAEATGAITNTLVGALHPRMEI